MKVIKTLTLLLLSALVTMCSSEEEDKKLPVKRETHAKNITQEIDTSKVSDLEKGVYLINKSNEPMKGVLLLQQVIAKDSSNYDAYFYTGKFYLQTGHIEKATSNFEQVIALNDTAIPVTFFYLAGLAEKESEDQKAINYLNRYLKFDLKEGNKQRAMSVLEQIRNKK